MDKPLPKKTVNRHHHINRLDNEKTRTHAWEVMLRLTGRLSTKQFTDGVYGGKRKSLQAAIIYRDELLAKSDLFAQQIWIRTKLRSNNKSGISGVFRHIQLDKRSPGSRSVCWIATWNDEFGARRSRRFSVRINGELEAKQMAIVERERQLERVCAVKGSHWRVPFIIRKRKIKPHGPVEP